MESLSFERDRACGNMCFKQKDYDGALRIYMDTCLRAEQALKEVEDSHIQDTDPTNTKYLKDQLGLLYFNISVAYTKIGLLRDAMAFVDKAICLSSSDKFLSRKALIYLKKGDYRSALRVCNEVKDKRECKFLNTLKCNELENVFKVISYPLDFSLELRYDKEELVIDLSFLVMITKEMKEEKVLPAKLVCSILKEGYSVLSNLDNVVFIDTPSEVYIFGDTHGQYFDVVSIVNRVGLSRDIKVIFNGDFVDRGHNSVENFVFILLLKIVFPEKVFLNRGNHEFEDLNRTMGFLAEIKRKYKLMHDIVYLYFSKVFSLLPIATIVNRKVFVTHGGLPGEPLSINEIQEINRKLHVLRNDQRLIGLMWSDPGEIDDILPSKRGIGVVFGRKVTQRFLVQNNLKLIVRSHEFVPNGFASHHDGDVVTVFSSPDYCQNVNTGAFLRFSWANKKVDYEVVTFEGCSRKEHFCMP